MRDYTGTQSPWQEIAPTRGWFRALDLRELWAYRDVTYILVQRELKLRYKQTALGVVWVFLQPLLGVVLFTLVFGELARLPSDGVAYPVFVYSGLLVWHYFQNSVAGATRILVEGRELVMKLYFPRLLAPLAAVLPRLIDVAIGLMALVVLMIVYDVAPGVQVILAPVWIVLAIVLSLGFGLIFAAANIQFRDVGHAIELGMQLWLFASPVVFPSSAVDGAWRVLLSLNPMTGIIDGFRWSVLDAPPPPALDLLSLAVGVVVFVGASAYFLRVERRFADVI